MVEITRILVFMSWIAFIKCQMEPFVVGGTPAKITHFPHSVFMYISCYEGHSGTRADWVCGGSVVNELIIMTAAHCIYGCSHKSTITVSVGHIHKAKGFQSSVRTFLIHGEYRVSTTSNDIALMKLRTPLQFGENVKKVALMKRPPYTEVAQLAGWGMNNEVSKTMSFYLMSVQQYVWKTSACRYVLHSIPKGTICAGSGDSSSFPSKGDSGSALVLRGYIQIGIVSYRMPSISKSLIVYTDTGYFYNWITKNTKKLYCVIEQS